MGLLIVRSLMLNRLICWLFEHSMPDYWDWYFEEGGVLYGKTCETPDDLKRWMWQLDVSQKNYLNKCTRCGRLR